MPTIHEPTCSCGLKIFRFHPDGSIATAGCLCQRDSYAPGRAYLKPHWWALRVVRFADKLTDCIAEFGERELKSTCLCASCSERIDDLDGALAALKDEVPQ